MYTRFVHISFFALVGVPGCTAIGLFGGIAIDNGRTELVPPGRLSTLKPGDHIFFPNPTTEVKISDGRFIGWKELSIDELQRLRDSSGTSWPPIPGDSITIVGLEDRRIEASIRAISPTFMDLRLFSEEDIRIRESEMESITDARGRTFPGEGVKEFLYSNSAMIIGVKKKEIQVPFIHLKYVELRGHNSSALILSMAGLAIDFYFIKQLPGSWH